MESDSELTPELVMWNQDEKVCITIKNATILEQEGELVAGLSLTPVNAISFAREILDYVLDLVKDEPPDDD